jgi:hypothetical protein
MGVAAETIEKIGREAGVSELDLSGWYADDVRAVYAKLNGTTVDKIDPDTDIDVLIKSIASIQAAKEVGVQTDKIMGKLSGLDRETQQKYSVIMSKDISNATLDFADSNFTLEQMATDLGLSVEELWRAFGHDSANAMEDSITELKEETKK